MAAHIRDLPTCAVCGNPATHALFNTRNAELGRYCHRHVERALAEFIERNPDHAPVP